MGRSPCCDKVGLKKGPWTPEEDQKLLAYIDQHGHGSWRSLPIKAGLQRCGKSCRLRWTNYLRPDIKRGKFSLQEEQTIIQLHALLGNRWSAIATHLAKRTDNEIKNYWNTHLKKRLMKMGIDPVTHKPKSDALISNNNNLYGGHSKSAANLSHMAQWESARLEAEARLVRESRLRSNPFQTSQSYRLFVNNEVGLDLESPSSTLSFPGAKAVVSVSHESKCCSEYLLESSGGSGGGGDQVVVVKDTWTPESMRGDHHEEHNNGFVVVMEDGTGADDDQAGFSELLLRNTIVVDGEVLDEDNKSYWNTILDLVNTSPSVDSPIF